MIRHSAVKCCNWTFCISKASSLNRRCRGSPRLPALVGVGFARGWRVSVDHWLGETSLRPPRGRAVQVGWPARRVQVREILSSCLFSPRSRVMHEHEHEYCTRTQLMLGRYSYFVRCEYSTSTALSYEYSSYSKTTSQEKGGRNTTPLPEEKTRWYWYMVVWTKSFKQLKARRCEGT